MLAEATLPRTLLLLERLRGTRCHVERPLAGCGVKAPAGDRERLDDEPGVPVGKDPRLRVEAFTKACGIGINVVERSPHEHRPALPVRRVDAVDFEGDLHRRLVDHVARPGAQRDPRPSAVLDEPVVDRHDDREVVGHERETPEGVLAQQGLTVIGRERLEPGIVHTTTIACAGVVRQGRSPRLRVSPAYM